MDARKKFDSTPIVVPPKPEFRNKQEVKDIDIEFLEAMDEAGDE